MRYRLLETVAEYTAERLDQAGDRDAAERRHLVCYRELARTTDPVLRGPGQHAAIALFQLEYENLRTALRRAVAARDEQEALCLVLSLGWLWQMLDLRADARHWAEAASALGPDPFAPPVEPAPALPERCTDAPPPMAPELLKEARRQVRLIGIVSMNHDAENWATPERLAWLRKVADAYRPGLPQTCRFPGSLWVFAYMLSGDPQGLRRVVDETVRACERLGYDWELASALHIRANIFSNRGDRAGDATRDTDRSLEIFQRLGDAWGIAEALSARGEARERAGEYRLAADDYRAAIGHAERLGAQSQAALLRSRLAATMFETGQGEEGERILREVLAEGRDTWHEAQPAARLFLALWLGRTGRGDEAREELNHLLDVFRSETLATFEGFVQGVFAWLDCADGRYATALEAARAAVEAALTPLSLMVAPEMAAVHLVTVAWALGGLAAEAGDRERGRDAARLIGAYEALSPVGHHPAFSERSIRKGARETVMGVLGEAAFEEARAEGGGLTLEEATTLAGC
ncbi:signal transduction response regulator [Streptomyces sp. L-9-10]|nr:signal transduction response regulator [Streptomyces sp. L-9-10]